MQKCFWAVQKIWTKKEGINELNVFPVPDGDTGTNMTMTITAAASEVMKLQDPDMETLAKMLLQDHCVEREETPELFFHSC